MPDVTWHRTDGQILSVADWERDTNHTLVAVLYAGKARTAIVFHADVTAVTVVLPVPRSGYQWQRELDSVPAGCDLTIEARSVTVFGEVAECMVPETAGIVRIETGIPDADLNRLSELAGIDPIWWDVEGGYHTVDVDTKRALLAAMRLPAVNRSDFNDSFARLTATPSLPSSITSHAEETITIPLGWPRPAWVTLAREDGTIARFHASNDHVVLPPQPLGRHRLLNEDRPDRLCHLTVAPDTGYLPPVLQAGERRFGIAAHLYTLRSKGDQGIGDFSTLAKFATEAAHTGAAMIGLNPLHALFPHDRSRTSPYHPSDRRFLDPIYIDVSAFPGGTGAPSQNRIVDYETVWNHKKTVLREAFNPSDNGVMTPAVRRFATFQAIAEVLGDTAWSGWPVELRHPENAGVLAFAEKHDDLVRFHGFLQGLADRQLASAAASAERNGLALGLYRDLAVGAAPDGAEAWSAQDMLMQGVSIGAPPDPFSANGQIWCLPPPDPVAIRRDGYAGFNELLAANMRHAGALRIDHVMGLRRLFVVPEGASATAGAYVSYPLTELLAQVALESQRSRCLVVGEDLGTVPEGMSERLAASNILSYSVLWFERRGGHIRPSNEWRRLAAACVSTHDLPTLAGWWNGADIAEKRSLSLLTDPGAERTRADEKSMLIALLRDEGLINEDVDPGQPMPFAVAAAIHRFVSATPALLTLVQADDLAGEAVAVNLPGTDRERSNWRRRLDVDVSTLCKSPLAQAIFAALASRATPRDA